MLFEKIIPPKRGLFLVKRITILELPQDVNLRLCKTRETGLPPPLIRALTECMNSAKKVAEFGSIPDRGDTQLCAFFTKESEKIGEPNFGAFVIFEESTSVGCANQVVEQIDEFLTAKNSNLTPNCQFGEILEILASIWSQDGKYLEGTPPLFLEF